MNGPNKLEGVSSLSCLVQYLFEANGLTLPHSSATFRKAPTFLANNILGWKGLLGKVMSYEEKSLFNIGHWSKSHKTYSFVEVSSEQ
jgi:hypothetical protein